MCLSSQDQYKTSLQDLIDILRSTLGRAEFKHVLSAASGSAGESWCGSPSEASTPLRKGLGCRDPLWVPIPRVHSFNTHVSTHVCTHSIHTCVPTCAFIHFSMQPLPSLCAGHRSVSVLRTENILAS